MGQEGSVNTNLFSLAFGCLLLFIATGLLGAILAATVWIWIGVLS